MYIHRTLLVLECASRTKLVTSLPIPTTRIEADGYLQDRPRHPGRKLSFTEPGKLTLRPFARCDSKDFVKDLLADFFDRPTLEDDAAVDVYVVFHSTIQLGIRSKLDRRYRLAAENGSATRR